MCRFMHPLYFKTLLICCICFTVVCKAKKNAMCRFLRPLYLKDLIDLLYLLPVALKAVKKIMPCVGFCVQDIINYFNLLHLHHRSP